jgi:hypothetical protein
LLFEVLILGILEAEYIQRRTLGIDAFTLYVGPGDRTQIILTRLAG